jgi:signal transduction histidine kinase
MGLSFVVAPQSKNRAEADPAGTRAQPREDASGTREETSGSRRRATDAAGGTTTRSRFAALRSVQVGAVGAAFLRARPLVVTPVAVINGVLVVASGAPLSQRIAMAAALGAALALFWIERWWVARAQVGERWLATSLTATVAVLVIGCGLSGGIASPLMPLVLAPVVVGAAAFGRSARTVVLGILAFALVGSLALLPLGTPFPPVPDPWSRAMLVTAFAGLLALSYAGVAGLVGAYVRAGEMLERMRVATLEEAASRMRATEQVGAKLAHELKNPLAAIKALLQILGDRVDEKGAKRLAVALAEVDRMDVIVREYLSFARPLADLEVAEVDLRALADDVVAVLTDRASLAGIALGVEGSSTTVHGDARRLREAVFNLTDNALAATPRGGTVTLAVAPRTLTITDTGCGIPPELVDAPAFTTTREEGTGLGLPIARGAIAQHGGTLAFTPRPGGGTIVTVSIPEGL